MRIETIFTEPTPRIAAALEVPLHGVTPGLEHAGVLRLQKVLFVFTEEEKAKMGKQAMVFYFSVDCGRFSLARSTRGTTNQTRSIVSVMFPVFFHFGLGYSSHFFE